MAPVIAHGERLIVSLIDSYARDDPKRPWVSVPIDDEDLSKGFRDINFAQFANAINHAARWLDCTLGRCEDGFEAFAYTGPKDLRYPILTMATVKVGRQIVLPSPFATIEAQEHIIDQTNCKKYLHAASLMPTVRQVLAGRPQIQDITVPELDNGLREDVAPVYEYTKSFHEAKDDPWIVFHTSGTTGLPRPIPYTNYMMSSLDAAELMPDALEETNNSQWAGKRWYTPIPTLHGPHQQFTLWIKFGHYGNAEGGELSPSFIEDICRDPTMLKHLQGLKYLYYVGAPLSKIVGDHLAGSCCLYPGIGSTEAGPYFTKIRKDEYWVYYTFRPAMDFSFKHWANDLHEMGFCKDKCLERWQQIFYLYTDLDLFHTKDLWSKQLSKRDLWAYAGRTDDAIIPSHGESLQASIIEADVGNDEHIPAVLVGDECRMHPFLITDRACGKSGLVPSRADRQTGPTMTADQQGKQAVFGVREIAEGIDRLRQYQEAISSMREDNRSEARISCLVSGGDRGALRQFE